MLSVNDVMSIHENVINVYGNKRTATALALFLNKKWGIKSAIFDTHSPYRLSLDVANGKFSYEDLLEMW
nr:MAG TPA: death on curing protein [Caudoviricetes sp.]